MLHSSAIFPILNSELDYYEFVYPDIEVMESVMAAYMGVDTFQKVGKDTKNDVKALYQS